MFKNYQEPARKPLEELYQLMLVGKLNGVQRQKKKTLRRQLRNIGLLSLPFSLNQKRFRPL